MLASGRTVAHLKEVAEMASPIANICSVMLEASRHMAEHLLLRCQYTRLLIPRTATRINRIETGLWCGGGIWFGEACVLCVCVRGPYQELTQRSEQARQAATLLLQAVTESSPTLVGQRKGPVLSPRLRPDACSRSLKHHIRDEDRWASWTGL